MNEKTDILPPADYVRALLGPRRIAEACGLFSSTPYKWVARVPSEHHRAILAYAKRIGAPLTAENLIHGGLRPEKTYVVTLPRGDGMRFKQGGRRREAHRA